MAAVDKMSSGMGAGMARPTSSQQTYGMDVASKMAGAASKAATKGVKAGKLKSIKVKAKFNGK